MRTFLISFCALSIAACGGKTGDKTAAAADSAARDLAQKNPTNLLGDTAIAPEVKSAVEAPPAPTKKPAAKPAPKPAPQSAVKPVEQSPNVPKPVAPAPSAAPRAAPSLAAGTAFDATATDSVSSRTTKSGETMKARVAADVKAPDGRVVIPAGATVTILLDQFKSAPAKGANETFSAKLVSVDIDGTSYPISGTVDHMEFLGIFICDPDAGD